jgi:peptidoglycan-associated lipoprotein
MLKGALMLRLVLLTVTLVASLAGCATTKVAPPAAQPASTSVDVTGRWLGTWTGYGVADISREESAVVELKQDGARGQGWLWLDNTGAAEGVPITVRHAGSGGVPVGLLVSGSTVVMSHDLNASLFSAEFSVMDDRMVGRVRGADSSVRIVLTRFKPEEPKPQAAESSPAPTPVAALPPQEPAPVVEAPKPAEVAVAPAPEPATEAVAQPEPSQPAQVAEVKTIHFEFRKADIQPGEVAVLETNARQLKENSDLQVLIEGHADERGTDTFNRALGERRARAARDYLVAQGVEAERISTVSHGEERPVCAEKTEECFAQNRRAELLVKPR